VMLVDEREIAAAVRDVFLDTRAVLEPAGAVSVAGLKQYVARRPPAPSAPPPAFVAIAGDASNIEFSNIWSVSSLLRWCRISFRMPFSCFQERQQLAGARRAGKAHPRGVDGPRRRRPSLRRLRPTCTAWCDRESTVAGARRRPPYATECATAVGRALYCETPRPRSPRDPTPLSPIYCIDYFVSLVFNLSYGNCVSII